MHEAKDAKHFCLTPAILVTATGCLTLELPHHTKRSDEVFRVNSNFSVWSCARNVTVTENILSPRFQREEMAEMLLIRTNKISRKPDILTVTDRKSRLR